MQVSCTFHFKGGKMNISFLEKELKNKAWLINTGLNIVFKLDQQKNTWLFRNKFN